jgi:hypothetical protein
MRLRAAPDVTFIVPCPPPARAPGGGQPGITRALALCCRPPANAADRRRNDQQLRFAEAVKALPPKLTYEQIKGCRYSTHGMHGHPAGAGDAQTRELRHAPVVRNRPLVVGGAVACGGLVAGGDS